MLRERAHGRRIEAQPASDPHGGSALVTETLVVVTPQPSVAFRRVRNEIQQRLSLMMLAAKLPVKLPKGSRT